MATYSLYLRRDPNDSSHHAYGVGYVQYYTEVEAKTLKEAKQLAAEFADDYDLGFLQGILTKGKVRETYADFGLDQVGVIVTRASRAYVRPSKQRNSDPKWSVLAPANSEIIADRISTFRRW